MGENGESLLYDLRIKHNLSRTGLAKMLGIIDKNSDPTEIKNAERRIKRAEQNATQKEFPLFLMACEILGEEFVFKGGRILMNSFSGNELVQYLERRSESAKTIQYNGLGEVIPAWKQWIYEYSDAVNRYGEGKSDEEWLDKNKYMVLFSCKTLDIKALRTYGQHFIEPYMFLFSTEWVPLFTHMPPKDESELLTRINNVMEMFHTLKSRIEEAEKPVVLLENVVGDDYLAFSIKENKKMFVFGFKEYSENFRVSDYEATSKADIKENDGYTVITFQDELINELGLQLFPSHWRYITPGTEWEYRKEKSHSGQDFGKYSDLYYLALKALNRLRTQPNDQSDLSWKLEQRIERFEGFFKDQAPEVLKDEEARLLRKALTELGEL